MKTGMYWIHTCSYWIHAGLYSIHTTNTYHNTHHNTCQYIVKILACIVSQYMPILTWSNHWGQSGYWTQSKTTHFLASLILAFSADLKRIQISHSSFRDFWADKTFTTCWSGGRFQVQVQAWVLAPACHLVITPEAIVEDNRRYSCHTDLVQQPKTFQGFVNFWLRQVTDCRFFIHTKWIFYGVQHMNQLASSKSNPVKKSWSKSMSCPRKGRLPR